MENDFRASASRNRSYVWVLLTYDWVYGLNQAYSSYFVEPYLSKIILDQHKASITESFRKTLHPTFVQHVLNDGWSAYLADNDIYKWAPRAPVQLYHGTSDSYVPYLNSQNAYKYMKEAGASNVQLISINGKDHSDAVDEYLIGTYLFFYPYLK